MKCSALIRPASLRDIQGLLELEALFPGDRLTRRSFRHLLVKGNADILVWVEEGTIAGNIVIFYRRRSALARVYSIVVHPSRRRQGVAKALLERAGQAALVRGCNRISLEVRADNQAALHLYLSLGFTIVCRIDGYYEDQTPAVRLEKKFADKRA